jgi:hypothetical protein
MWVLSVSRINHIGVFAWMVYRLLGVVLTADGQVENVEVLYFLTRVGFSLQAGVMHGDREVACVGLEWMCV